MAGMGIRALELARALQTGGFDVDLLVGNDPGEAREAAGSVPVTHAPPGRLAAAAGAADAAVVSGHAANDWFREAPGVPVAADLYDPFPIENLHYVASLGEGAAGIDRAAFSLSLARADFFLCASPAQRLFYAGALYDAGRVGPKNFPADPGLADLLAVVPFGAPEAPARGDARAGREAAGAAGAGPVVLFGGIYDWYDPTPVLEAWPRILERHPAARLLFFDSPNPETTPQRLHALARERARSLDPGGRSILFSPWLPYERRADLYAGCDLLVSVSSPGLEADLAFRTRLLDAAWGGVPSVSVAGGALADALEREGAGVSVEREPPAIAAVVAALLADPPRRATLSQNARRFAAERTWRRVAAPLADWCRRARIDPNRRPVPGGKGPSVWSRLFGGDRDP